MKTADQVTETTDPDVARMLAEELLEATAPDAVPEADGPVRTDSRQGRVPNAE